MGKGAQHEKVVREIQRRTRRRFSAEEKIRIILEGLRGEESIADAVPARRAGAESVLPVEQGVSRGRKEAAARRHDARGDGAGSADAARREYAPEAGLAETVLENRLLKKSVTASDSEDDTCA